MNSQEMLAATDVTGTAKVASRKPRAIAIA
jgi:hypothetical protein